MALVNYGSSDSEEDNELELPEERETNNRIDTSDKNETKSAIQDESSNRSDNNQSDDDDLRLTNDLKLPQPSTDSKAKSLISNLSTSKANGKVRIFLPSFKGAAEDDEHKEKDDEREFKRFKYSTSRGSGLKSLLPPPKNQVKTSSAKSTTFLPDVLKRRAEQNSNRPSTSKSSSSVRADDDEDESVNFFSFDQTVKSNSVPGDLKPTQPVMPNRFETDLIKSRFGDASIKPISSHANSSASQPAGLETEYQKERKLKYEIEKQFKDEVGDEIKIQEVNIVNHLNDNLDYLKAVSEERQQDVSGPLPSMMAKRKHQLTYLAFQAKQNELKLKNEWAQGRANRDQARSKYGF